MQKLWSRVAQTSSCRCHSCVNNTAHLTRKATTHPIKRRLNSRDVFTACYSAVLASAALADARFKDERSKEWERRIEEAKSFLSRGDGRDAIMSDGASGADVAARALYTPKVMEESSEVILLSTVVEIPARVQDESKPTVPSLSLLEEEMFSNDPEILARRLGTGVDGEDISLNENAIETRRTPLLSLQIRDELDFMQGSVTRLATKLMSKSLQECGSSDRQLSTNFRQPLTLSDVLAGRIPPPSYDVHSENHQPAAQGETLANFQSLFAKADTEKQPTRLIMATICFNLLTISSPPSIGIYNMLISELTRLRLHPAARAVIESLLEDSIVKPNETTNAAILRYFIATNDEKSFRKQVRLMFGVRASGHDLDELLSGMTKERMKWRRKQQATRGKGQADTRTCAQQKTYDALIRGALEFRGAKYAVLCAREAVMSGYKLSRQVFINMASCCLLLRDYSASLGLIRVMAAEWLDTAYNPAENEFNKEVRFHIHALLSLCGLRTRTDDCHGRDLRDGGLRYAFGQMLRHTEIMSIDGAIHRRRCVIRSLHKLVEMNPSGRLTETSVSAMRSFLATSRVYDEKRARDASRLELVQNVPDARKYVTRLLFDYRAPGRLPDVTKWPRANVEELVTGICSSLSEGAKARFRSNVTRDMSATEKLELVLRVKKDQQGAAKRAIFSKANRDKRGGSEGVKEGLSLQK